MRPHYRLAIVLALTVGLLAVFLHHVDLRRVAVDIRRARALWLLLSLLTMVLNLAIRARRWQFLLEPIGRATFANAFRATAVGFAANAVLPARAGEIIRPYFLSRHEQVSATGAFATVILERVLDTLTVLVLLAVFVGGRAAGAADPLAMRGVKWAGVAAGGASVGILIAMVAMAGHPARVAQAVAGLERMVPSAVAGLLARTAKQFTEGLGAIRRPDRLLVALLWSFPLWLSVAAGIWAVARAFGFNVPFTGSFLLLALLVIGVAIPTPGAIGGFDEAFRFGTTAFFGAQNDAAVGAALVLHLLSIGPSLLMGAVFVAQDGLSVTGIWHLAGGVSQQSVPRRQR